MKYAWCVIAFGSRTTQRDNAFQTSVNPLVDRIRRAMQEKPGRRLSEPEYSRLPKAAVCMILKPDPESRQLVVLLLKRKVSESDQWSGHMAFPGGRAHDDDGAMIDTASRELMEESGIDSRKCEVLGTLDDLFPGNRSVVVTPFVFVVPESTDVKIDSREITEHVWIPIDFFMDKKNSTRLQIERFGNGTELPCFSYLGTYLVWGMTLGIIQDFLTKIK